MLGLAAFGLLLAVGLTAHFWGWSSKPAEWLPPGLERHAFEIASREFQLVDDLMVVVGGPDPAARERFLTQLAARLAERPDLYTDVLYEVDLAPVRRGLLYYLNVAQLAGLDEALASAKPLLSPKQSLSSWVGLMGGKGKDSELSADLGAHYVKLLEQCLKSHGRATFTSPLKQLLDPEQAALMEPFWEGRTKIFLPIDEGRRLLMFARPGKNPAASLAHLRDCLAEIGPRNPDVQAELTGFQAIAEEQAASLQASLGQAVFIALSLVLVALWFNVLPPGRLLAGMMAWGVGLGWTAGLGALRLGGTGPLWVAGLCLAAVISGFLTIQTIWLHHLRLTVRVSLAGSLALACLTFSGAPALGAVGQVAALGLLATLVAQLTVLPALTRPSEPPAWASAPLMPSLQRAGAVILTTAVVMVGCLLWLRSLSFEADPLALVDRQAPSLQMEMQLGGAQTSTLYAMMLAQDQQRARALLERLEQLPVVDNVFCIARFLPSDTALKRPWVESLCRRSRGLGVPQPIPLGTAQDMLNLEAHVGHGGGGSDLLGSVDLERMGPGEIQDALRAFQDGILGDLRRLISLLEAQAPEPLRVEDLPASVRERTVGSSGRICLMIFPRFRYAESAFLEGSVYEGFVAQLQRVNPEVSGPAVMVALATRLSRQAHMWALGLAWVGLLIGLVVQLRSLLYAGLVLLGPTLAWLLTAALLFARGVTPNLINWPVPIIHLILGTSFSLDSLRRPRLSARVLGPALAVLAAALVLGFSRHPALAGLGYSLGVSLATNLLVACTVVPALRRLLQVLVKIMT